MRGLVLANVYQPTKFERRIVIHSKL